MDEKTIARFWSKVDKSGDCWNWRAYRDRLGYGKVRIRGRSERAHRIAWAAAHGAMPCGTCVLHKCDNRACCNPEHLFLGTQLTNIRDMCSKGRQRGSSCRGERHGRAKITDDDVRRIRQLSRSVATGSIAATYGLSRKMIRNIVQRRNWSHVD